MTTCDHCEQPAIYHDVRILNGVHNTTHLCIKHAIETGVSLGPIDLSVVLHASQGIPHSDTSKACLDCGMTLGQYKEKSLLGCPTCYETFREELENIIAKVQDNHSHHIGRAPKHAHVDISRHLQIRRILKQLDSAVNQEDYEQAAVLRDQLRELYNSDEHHEN
jgi:protein arginine kinase activator